MKKKELRESERKAKLKKQEIYKLKVSDSVVSQSVIEDDEEKDAADKSLVVREAMHTTLTSFSALQYFRRYRQECFSIYVKVMPAGCVRKINVDPTLSVYNFYNMAGSHISSALSDSSMMLLPTSSGLYEISTFFGGYSTKDDFHRGPNTLGDYRLRCFKKKSIVMFFFTRYKREAVPGVISSFFETNSAYRINTWQMPVYTHSNTIPDLVERDVAQTHLRSYMRRYHSSQERQERQYFRQKAHETRAEHIERVNMAVLARSLNRKPQKTRMDRRDRRQMEYEKKLAEEQARRMESQLKKLPEARQQIARKALTSRADLQKQRRKMNTPRKSESDGEAKSPGKSGNYAALSSGDDNSEAFGRGGNGGQGGNDSDSSSEDSVEQYFSFEGDGENTGIRVD
jgi:hypothetical protein